MTAPRPCGSYWVLCGAVFLASALLTGGLIVGIGWAQRRVFGAR